MLEAERQKQIERQQFREDIILDFAAFESSIARIQFLRTSNEKERERYASEKLKIQATAQAVRDNTAELRVQLEEAQKTLALRKTYDELAEKITSNRLLRPREDQQANLKKLHAEIAELERESKEYAQTWSERRDQFGRIVEEGMQLRRLIRDEKEEVERREGMEEEEDGEDGDASRGRTSTIGTPRPDHGGLTPMHPSQEPGSSVSVGLLVEKQRAASANSPLRRARPASPGSDGKKPDQEAQDTAMVDEGEVDESVPLVVSAGDGAKDNTQMQVHADDNTSEPGAKVFIEGREEGEESGEESHEQMDTT